MTIATRAKGGSDGLLTHLIDIMSSKSAWAIAVAFLLIVIISEQDATIKLSQNCKRD